MQNLYDILGVPRSASNKEINAALRQLVRRYNEETALGTRDYGEALKCVNYARITFIDPQRRAKYDAELDLYEAAQQKAAALAEENLRPPALGQPVPADPWATQSPADPVATAAPPAAPREASNSSPRRLDPVIVSAPEDLSSHISFPTTSGLGANTGYDMGPVLASSSGTKKRSTAARPGARLAARFVDYGCWGLILASLLHFLSSAGTLSSGVAQTLAHPFVAPIIITLSWAIVEALLLIFFPLTPGKFLFNIRVGLNVSNPYALTDPSAHLAASFSRALQVWWRGMAGTLFPIYFISLARAYRRLRSFKETSWDFDNDCLVTHDKLSPLNVLVAAALLMGGSWLYVNQWMGPLQNTISVSWRSAEAGLTAARETWKVLRGDMPNYAKNEIPLAPPKENRTVALEKEAQTLIDQRQWKNLSEHCSAWKQEDERNAAAWSCYGRARHELADYGGAITALKRAVLLAPQDDDIRGLLKNASLIDMQQKQLRRRIDADQNRPAGSVGG